MASETLTPIKKAAAIVIALGAERASEVYKFLNEEEIEQLSIQPSEQIITLERLRYSDGKPVLLELNKFPESFSFLFGVNLTDASLY